MIFSKTQLAKYADVMIWAMENARRGGKFKKYDSVLVRYDKAALPLAHAIYERLLDKKYLPTVKTTLPEEMEKLNQQFQIDYVCPKCKQFLGFMPFEGLRNRGHCSACKSKWVRT